MIEHVVPKGQYNHIYEFNVLNSMAVGFVTLTYVKLIY